MSCFLYGAARVPSMPHSSDKTPASLFRISFEWTDVIFFKSTWHCAKEKEYRHPTCRVRYGAEILLWFFGFSPLAKPLVSKPTQVCHKCCQLIRSWLKSTYLLQTFSRVGNSELEPPSVTAASHAPPPPLIPFGPSFPLPPPRVLLGLLLFAARRGRSVGVLAESVEGAVGDGLARFGRGGLAPGLLAAVGLVVEVAKEDDEGDGVADEGIVHPVREVAVDVEGQGRVADGDVELDLRGTTEGKTCSQTTCI